MLFINTATQLLFSGHIIFLNTLIYCNLLVHIYFFNLKFDILHTSHYILHLLLQKITTCLRNIYIYIFTLEGILNNYINFILLIKIQIGTLVSFREYPLYSQHRVLPLKQLKFARKNLL